MDEKDRHDAGMTKRRATLGDAYVDRSIANATDLNREFQELITRYAWGEIWTRPGLDERTRCLIVIATTMATGRWEEFDLHLRAALSHGMALGDVKEVLMQQAIYAGVPASNTAFHRAAAIIGELEAQGVEINRG
ncbi:MAG: 4-carboxymuconolactone decarboxylase [Tepidamorphaceae bacterium]|nr:4-carboxymuconolactone decarboxylase [Nitratireductor sp.]MCC0048072.1 4-carboxymuconolactone decarboxylase [Rhodobiaceae bacterium]